MDIDSESKINNKLVDDFHNSDNENEIQYGSGWFDKIKSKFNFSKSNHTPPPEIMTPESLKLVANAKRDENQKLLKSSNSILDSKPTPKPTPTSIKSRQNLLPKKCFILDFDCTITYSHWAIYLLNYNKWYDEFLLNDPNYIKLSNEQKITTFKKLGKISSIINKVIATNDKLGYRENILLLEKKIDNTETQLLLLTYIMGGIERRNMICSFLKTLIKNGFNVVIASRGYTINIRMFLNFMKIYDNITINAHNVCTYKNNKPDVCKYITKDNYIISLLTYGYKIIRYVDDDSSEHNNLQKVLRKMSDIDYKYYGSNIGLNLNEHGLTQDCINKIYADIGISSKDICSWNFNLKPNNLKKYNNSKAVIFNMDHTITTISWYTFTEKITNIGAPCEKNIERYFKGPTITRIRNASDEVILLEAITEYKKKVNINIVDAIISCVFGETNIESKLKAIKDTFKYFKNNNYDIYLITSANYNYTILLFHLMDLYLELHKQKDSILFTNLIDKNKIIAFKYSNPKGSNFRDIFLTSLKKTNYKKIYFVDSKTDGIVAKSSVRMPNSIMTSLYIIRGLNNTELIDNISMQKGGQAKNEHDKLSSKIYKYKYLKYKKKYLYLKP